MLTEELKNNAVDIDHLREKESKKKRQLLSYRTILNDIVLSISNLNKEIEELKQRRVEENAGIDKLMGRGEELIECLAKK